MLLYAVFLVIRGRHAASSGVFVKRWCKYVKGGGVFKVQFYGILVVVWNTKTTKISKKNLQANYKQNLCSTLSTGCVDANEKCPWYKTNGYCINDYPAVLDNCKASCGLCWYSQLLTGGWWGYFVSSLPCQLDFCRYSCTLTREWRVSFVVN